VSGDDEVTPDGSPVPVYLALPPDAGFAAVLDDLAPEASVLDLGCGVGRLVNRLARPGREVVGVDESPAMLRHLAAEVRPVAARIEGLDLGRRFDAVVLASYLVDVADTRQRHAFLEAVARHLAPAGTAYLQRHDPDAATYAAGATTRTELPTAQGTLTLQLVVHERRDAWLRATSTMELAGRRWSQTFESELLDDPAIDATLSAASLRLDRVLDGTWVTAVHDTRGHQRPAKTRGQR
jgi:2-polyprenyl-3-methyl-5-hydroxy-6-metoxy-1,4-benzoquinol methylase